MRILAREGRKERAVFAGLVVVLAGLLAVPPAPRANAAEVTDPARGRADPEAVPDGSFVRVTVDGGVSPFTSVSWDVTVRGGTAVVSFVKESLCQTGQRERVRLLEGENARDLLSALRDASAWTCAVPGNATAGRAADRPPSPDQPRYEVWSAWGHRMVRYHLPQSALWNSPCTLGLITALSAEVRSRVEPLPMRDLYYPADRLGFVTMTASETATATFDGWDVARLPVDALEMVEGEHDVVVTGVSGHSRQFRIKVAPGLTQRVHVMLENADDGLAPLPAPAP